MDIFAELEKLRMKPFANEHEFHNVGGYRNALADKHNETLDGIIEWLKGPIAHIVDIPFTLEDFNKAIQFVIKNKEINE